MRHRSAVQQGSASAGTGDIVLAAPDGGRSFYSAYGAGGSDMFFYLIRHRTETEWEAGTGHLRNAATLVRDTVIASSCGGGRVDFSAGGKDVVNGSGAEFTGTFHEAFKF